MRLIAAALLALVGLAGPAAAATRGFTITDFDRVRLAGPYDVTLRVGSAVSAKAEGSGDALDRVRLDVQGSTLTIRLDRTQSLSGEAPAGLKILLTAPLIRAASVTGSGSLALDHARAETVTLAVAGTGTLTADGIVADRLVVTLIGAGGMTLGGKAAGARVVAQGGGTVAAGKLIATDADLTLGGAGAITIGASRTAKVAAQGSGDVTVLGTPTCTVRVEGTGQVRCGPGGGAR